MERIIHMILWSCMLVRTYLSNLHSSDLYILCNLWLLFGTFVIISWCFLTLIFGRRVRLCILVSQCCLINHSDFLIDHARETYSSRSRTFSNQTLYLPLPMQLLIYVDLIEIALLQFQCPITLYFSLVFEGGLFPKFLNKCTLIFFRKIPILILPQEFTWQAFLR
jgi:hypothetical protein